MGLENLTCVGVWGLENSTWELVSGLEIVAGGLSDLGTPVGAGKSYLGWFWAPENRTCSFVCPQKPLQSELWFCASAKIAAE